MAGLTSPGLRSWGCRQSLTDLSAQVSLVPGCVALYLFNEGAGTVLTDYSGTGKHGTLGAGGAAPTWGVTGLTFDGGDYVNLGVLPAGTLFADATHQFTVQAVVTPVLNTAHASAIVAQASGTAGNRTFYLAYGGADKWSTRLRGTDTVPAAPVTAIPTLVTLTWDGTAAAFALNTASAEALNVGTAAEETTEATLIGARTLSTPAFFWEGPINVVAIYPFALSAPQRAQNYAYLKELLRPRGVALP